MHDLLSTILWSQSIYSLKCKARILKINCRFNRQPMKFPVQWCYIAELVRGMNHSNCAVHDVLELVSLIFEKAKEEGVTVVDLG